MSPVSLGWVIRCLLPSRMHDSGYLAANRMWRWSFFLCGGLKTVYDIALLISARHMQPDSERSPQAPSA